MARPEKLTLELTEQIASLVRDGNSPSTSAVLCGISSSTFFNWMKRGRGQEPRFLEFSESIERASSQAVIRCVAHIHRAAVDGHWRAAAWLLERTRPEQYGKRSRGVMERDTNRLGTPTQASIERLEEMVLQLQLRRQNFKRNIKPDNKEN